MTTPVATPVVFFVAGSAAALPELVFCDAIPKSRRFFVSFIERDVFPWEARFQSAEVKLIDTT